MVAVLLDTDPRLLGRHNDVSIDAMDEAGPE